jgi:hypothetical protein
MKEFSRYTLAYVLWVVSFIMAGGIGLIARESFVNLLAFLALPATKGDKAADFYMGLQIRAAETWSYVFLGFLVVVVIVFVEFYYRAGAAKGHLLVRFLVVTAVELGLLALAHLSNFIIVMSLGSNNWLGAFLPLIEIMVTGIFVWLYLRLKKVNVPLD